MWEKLQVACLLALFFWITPGCSDDTESTLSKESAPTEKTVSDTQGAAALKTDATSGENGEESSSADKKETVEELAVPEEEEGLQPAPRIKGRVALVNGKEINKAKFYAELDKAAKHGAKIPPERVARIRANILNRMIEFLLEMENFFAWK